MINNNNFKITVPDFNPLSREYISFWKDFKRKCMEGMWVGGKYMPGPLFFYINAWSILLNKTREEVAKEYVTKQELKDDMSTLMERIQKIDEKLDKLFEVK